MDEKPNIDDLLFPSDIDDELEQLVDCLPALDEFDRESNSSMDVDLQDIVDSVVGGEDDYDDDDTTTTVQESEQTTPDDSEAESGTILFKIRRLSGDCLSTAAFAAQSSAAAADAFPVIPDLLGGDDSNSLGLGNVDGNNLNLGDLGDIGDLDPSAFNDFKLDNFCGALPFINDGQQSPFGSSSAPATPGLILSAASSAPGTPLMIKVSPPSTTGTPSTQSSISAPPTPLLQSSTFGGATSTTPQQGMVEQGSTITSVGQQQQTLVPSPVKTTAPDAASVADKTPSSPASSRYVLRQSSSTELGSIRPSVAGRSSGGHDAASPLSIDRLFKTKPVLARDKKLPSSYNQMLTAVKLRHLFKCMDRMCSFTTDSRQDFASHLDDMHVRMEIRFDAATSTTAAPEYSYFFCAYCMEYHASTVSLTEHVYNIHGPCAYQCNRCFFRGVTRSYVLIHQSNMHPLLGTNGQPLQQRDTDVIDCEPVQSAEEHRKPDLKEVVIAYQCRSGFAVVTDETGATVLSTAPCRFRTVDPNVYMDHLTTKHPGMELRCHLCDEFTSQSPYRLIKHYQVHDCFVYQCCFCLFGAETNNDMCLHLCLAHPQFPGKVLMRGQAIKEPVEEQERASVPRQPPPDPLAIDEPLQQGVSVDSQQHPAAAPLVSQPPTIISPPAAVPPVPAPVLFCIPGTSTIVTSLPTPSFSVGSLRTDGFITGQQKQLQQQQQQQTEQPLNPPATWLTQQQPTVPPTLPSLPNLAPFAELGTTITPIHKEQSISDLRSNISGSTAMEVATSISAPATVPPQPTPDVSASGGASVSAQSENNSNENEDNILDEETGMIVASPKKVTSGPAGNELESIDQVASDNQFTNESTSVESQNQSSSNVNQIHDIASSSNSDSDSDEIMVLDDGPEKKAQVNRAVVGPEARKKVTTTCYDYEPITLDDSDDDDEDLMIYEEFTAASRAAAAAATANNGDSAKESTDTTTNAQAEGGCDFASTSPLPPANVGLSGFDLYKCSNYGCDTSCETQSDLKDHLMVCDNQPREQTAPFNCMHCRRGFKVINTFLEHLKLHGPKRFATFCNLNLDAFSKLL